MPSNNHSIPHLRASGKQGLSTSSDGSRNISMIYLLLWYGVQQWLRNVQFHYGNKVSSFNFHSIISQWQQGKLVESLLCTNTDTTVTKQLSLTIDTSGKLRMSSTSWYQTSNASLTTYCGILGIINKLQKQWNNITQPTIILTSDYMIHNHQKYAHRYDYNILSKLPSELYYTMCHSPTLFIANSTFNCIDHSR
jgi:hypothetical protein